MSKKDSGNNLHDLLHNKSMTSAKKTFTFSTAGSNGKLPQLTDDNIVADSPAPMAVVDAESDDSEESEEEEMGEEQGASEHTVSTSTTIGQVDSPKSSEKAKSLREKSRTVKFPSNLVQDAEEKAPLTESTSKHGDSNKGVLAKSKTVKSSAKVRTPYLIRQLRSSNMLLYTYYCDFPLCDKSFIDSSGLRLDELWRPCGS